jgi:hypothetical protein
VLAPNCKQFNSNTCLITSSLNSCRQQRVCIHKVMTGVGTKLQAAPCKHMPHDQQLELLQAAAAGVHSHRHDRCWRQTASSFIPNRLKHLPHDQQLELLQAAAGVCEFTQP